MLPDVGLFMCQSCVGKDSYSGMLMSHPEDASPLHPLALTFLLPTLLRCFLSLTVVDVNVSDRDDRSTITYSQHFNQLRASVLLTMAEGVFSGQG